MEAYRAMALPYNVHPRTVDAIRWIMMPQSLSGLPILTGAVLSRPQERKCPDGCFDSLPLQPSCVWHPDAPDEYGLIIDSTKKRFLGGLAYKGGKLPRIVGTYLGQRSLRSNSSLFVST